MDPDTTATPPTTGNDASETVTVATGTRPAAPAEEDADKHYEIDYDKETVKAKEGENAGDFSYEIREKGSTSDDDWKSGDFTFEPGKTYELRIKANGDVPPSDPVEFTAPDRGAAPEAVQETEKTISKSDSSITLNNTDEQQEYVILPQKPNGEACTNAEIETAFNGGHSQSGVAGGELTFTRDGNGDELSPDTECVVYNRKKAVTQGEKAIASRFSASRPVRTKKAAPKAPAKPSVKKVSKNRIEVKTMTGQEYSINGGKTWQKSGVFTGLKPNKVYTVLTRVAETKNTVASAASALRVRTAKTIPSTRASER